MASRLFEGKNVMKTLKNIIKRCEVYQKNDPKTEKLAKSGLQRNGTYPGGEDWEIDFTHMRKANGYSCLQVWVDTFTGWIEAFLCRSEQAKEVIRILFISGRLPVVDISKERTFSKSVNTFDNNHM